MAAAYVYILDWPGGGGSFLGVTADVLRRVRLHRDGQADGPPPRLVYVEAMGSLVAALAREQQLRQWRRDWIDRLIAARNPGRQDLLPTLAG